MLATIGSSVIYALIILAFTRSRAGKVEILADKEIDRASQDQAARTAKPVALELAPELPPLTRLET
jgi:hypothetical protein